LPYKSSDYFTFDGELSSDFGITNCKVDSGLYNEQFQHSREIVSTYIRGRSKPYYQYKKPSPLELDVVLYFNEGFTDTILSNLKNLFDRDYFVPMIFSDDLNKIYYVMLSDESTLSHDGQSGYVELKFICDNSYTYSQNYTVDYDYSINPTFQEIIFNNEGDTDCLPYIVIEKVGNGDISIVSTDIDDTTQLNTLSYLDDIYEFDTTDEIEDFINYLTDSDAINSIEFTFIGLVDSEILKIDNENEIIETSIPLTYRYDNFSGNYLILKHGYSNLIVTGTCKLYFEYNFRYL